MTDPTIPTCGADFGACASTTIQYTASGDVHYKSATDLSLEQNKELWAENSQQIAQAADIKVEGQTQTNDIGNPAVT